VTALVGAGLQLAFTAGLRGAGADVAVMRAALAFRSLRLLAVVYHLRAWPFLAALQPVLRAARRVFLKFMSAVFFFFVVVFIFSVVAMATMGTTRHAFQGDNLGGNLSRSNGVINNDHNFEDIWHAMWTLFIFSTGENWNFGLIDLMVQPPYCVSSGGLDDNCGSPVFAPLFFVAYMLINDLVIGSLTAALVLESYWREAPAAAQFVGWDDPAGRSLYVFTHAAGEGFRDAWAYFDPHGDARGLTPAQLTNVIALVDEPLGVRVPGGIADAEDGGAGAAARSAAVVEELGLGARDAVPFHEALFALVMRASRGSAFSRGGKAATPKASETP